MIYVVLTNVVAVIVVLGIMILVHEWGHFAAAKFFGIRVHVFSFGFGPRLFGVERGGTDYRVSALPLGGYVKMAGENPGDPASGAPDEFMSKPRWQRFIVAVMGPAMNVLLAIGLLAGLFMFRYQKPAYQEGPAIIGEVENGSAAAAAGIQPGDRILRLNGHENPNWQDVELLVASNPGRELEVAIVDRGRNEFVRKVKPEPQGRSQLGSAGWYPVMPAKLQAVEPGLPAALAGLQGGDEIVSVNGTPIHFWPKITEILQSTQGQDLEVGFLRNGELRTAHLRPVQGSMQGDPQTRWRIGVAFANEMITRQLGFSEALAESLETNRKFAFLIFDFVGKMFRQEMSVRTLEGPIGIARLSGQAARQGFPELISLMAAISLNLGIFNLFPIPVLDGGMILLLLIEGLIRRDLSLQVKERITQVGFAFLMLLAVLVIYNDIIKSLPERFERFFP
ncbi:MAG: RIP metalloprotease RseP [Acidobacteria bacterium]|nr:RIP metalloprotease RseP [Acidobacteriota bacterium]